MDNIQVRNRSFEGLAWGAFFIWWGLTELFQFSPNGTGVLGFGLILIGLNAARFLNGIPTSGFTLMLGILAVVWGGLELAGFFFSRPFEIPIFAVLLIVLGIIMLARELMGTGTK